MCPWWKKIMSFVETRSYKTRGGTFCSNNHGNLSSLHHPGFWYLVNRRLYQTITPLTGDLLLAIETTIAGVLCSSFSDYSKTPIRKISHMKSLIAMILLGRLLRIMVFAQAVQHDRISRFCLCSDWIAANFTILARQCFSESIQEALLCFAADDFFASILFWLSGTQVLPSMPALFTPISMRSSQRFSGEHPRHTPKIVVTKTLISTFLGLRLLFTGLLGLGDSLHITWDDRAQRHGTKISMNPLNIVFLIFVSRSPRMQLSTIVDFGMYRPSQLFLSSLHLLTGFIIDYILYDSIPSPMKVVAAMTILMISSYSPHCHFMEEKHQKLLIQNA